MEVTSTVLHSNTVRFVLFFLFSLLEDYVVCVVIQLRVVDVSRLDFLRSLFLGTLDDILEGVSSTFVQSVVSPVDQSQDLVTRG